MAEKMFNTRIQHKHDVEANWLKAVNFVPKAGELIVYDPDENFSYARTKMGDGLTGVNDLPFVQIQSDWNQNDENAADYVKNRTHYEIPDVWTEAEIVDDGWGGRATCKLAFSTEGLTESGPFKLRIDEIEYKFEELEVFNGSNATSGKPVYYLGAEYIPLNSNMDFSTYPFCILTQDFIDFYAVFEDGSLNHTVDFLISKGEIHYLDPKYIKDMYYEESTTTMLKEPISINCNTATTYGGISCYSGNAYAYWISGWPQFVGKSIRVVFDGQPYDVAIDDDRYMADLNNYPFALYETQDRVYFYVFESGTHTFEFYFIEKNIHYIDPKYIKDMYYESTTTTDISGESYTISGITASNLTVSHDTIPLELGQVWMDSRMHYSGNWTGSTEREVQQADDGTLYLGSIDPSLANGGAGFYTTANTTTFDKTIVGAGYGTIKFTCISGTVNSTVIHQIDEKYLPDFVVSASENAVQFVEQSLTDEQKQQAQDNIGINIATDDEILEMLAQEDMLPVVADSDGSLLADENNNILLW